MEVMTLNRYTTKMNKRNYDPLMELIPEQAPEQPDDACWHYAVRQDWDGSVDVCILDCGDGFDELVKDYQADDGTIYWRSLPRDVEYEIYVEKNVEVSLDDVATSTTWIKMTGEK